MLGELGLYTDAPATATVVVDEPVIVRHVSAGRIEQLERDDPAAAADLHRRLATIVAERLRTANDAVDSFRDLVDQRTGDQPQNWSEREDDRARSAQLGVLARISAVASSDVRSHHVASSGSRQATSAAARG